MSKQTIIAIIMIIAFTASMGMIGTSGLKDSTLKADRASMTTAVADYYRRFETVPLTPTPLKDISLDRVPQLYAGLVSVFGEEYVDGNLFLFDTEELKAVKSLQKLVDNRRPWVGNSTDPSFIVTVEDTAELSFAKSYRLEDRTLVVLDSSATNMTRIHSLAPFGGSSVLAGGEGSNTLIEVDINSNGGITDLSSMLGTHSRVGYVSRAAREIFAIVEDGGVGKIRKFNR